MTWEKEDRSKRTPMALLPYQARWSADMSQVKVIEKSRRIGLSWGEAAEDSLLAASEHGMDVWYIGYNKDMAQEFIEDCADWSRFYQLAAGQIEETVLEDEDKAIRIFRIRYASGHKITALSSRPSNLRGKQGKIVIDEAAFHENLPGLLKAAIAMLMWGGRVVVISTHFGDANPFNELINEIRAGKKPYSLHTVTLDDAIAEGLYRRICLRLGTEHSAEGEKRWRDDLVKSYGDDADEELFCVPSQGGGRYFQRSLVVSCMRKGRQVLRWRPPASDFVDWPDRLRFDEVNKWLEENLQPIISKLGRRKIWVGEDFGRDIDLTVLWPFEEESPLSVHVPFTLELSDMPFRQQEQTFFYLCDNLPWFIGAALDARGNGQYLAERARQKYGAERILEVMLTQPFYREWFPKYRTLYEDHVLDVPDDEDILDDHLAVVRVKGVPCIPDSKRTTGKSDLTRHGDSAVAGLLGAHAREMIMWGPAEYQSASKRRFAEQKGAY